MWQNFLWVERGCTCGGIWKLRISWGSFAATLTDEENIRNCNSLRAILAQAMAVSLRREATFQGCTAAAASASPAGGGVPDDCQGGEVVASGVITDPFATFTSRRLCPGSPSPT